MLISYRNGIYHSNKSNQASKIGISLANLCL